MTTSTQHSATIFPDPTPVMSSSPSETSRCSFTTGQNDVVVNTAGVLQYLNGLNWEGIGAWKRTIKQIWTRYGEVKGWAKVSGNLWSVMVNGAGHMVPTDQPEAAFTMLGHFIANEHDWKQ